MPRDFGREDVNAQLLGLDDADLGDYFATVAPLLDAERRRRALDRRATGESLRSIGAALGLSKTTLHRWTQETGREDVNEIVWTHPNTDRQCCVKCCQSVNY